MSGSDLEKAEFDVRSPLRGGDNFFSWLFSLFCWRSDSMRTINSLLHCNQHGNHNHSCLHVMLTDWNWMTSDLCGRVIVRWEMLFCRQCLYFYNALSTQLAVSWAVTFKLLDLWERTWLLYGFSHFICLRTVRLTCHVDCTKALCTGGCGITTRRVILCRHHITSICRRHCLWSTHAYSLDDYPNVNKNE